MDVAGQVALRFTGDVVRAGNHVNLSAVRADGTHLWVAGDETATIERLVLDSATAPTRAGRQRSFRLADLVQLPGPPSGEADIEGIARSGPWLWAIGSHALVRRRPKPVHDEAKVVRRLGKIRRDPNRYVIVRLAVQLGVDRRPEPVRVARDGRRSALVGAPGAETLVDLLRADAHLAPFLSIPSKDNGFDVEGLAVVGERLYVGLRGPVLRGWAVVLELRPVQDPTDPGRLALGIFPEGARYRKHFLDLDGLGVRDLCPDGDDLLVLAGPTMALSGPVRVHRWHGAATADTSRVVRDVDVTVETVLTYGEGVDHAEGIALLNPDPLDPRARLLVVYDSPATTRRPWPDTVLADRVRIGPEEDETADTVLADDRPADDGFADDVTADGEVGHGEVGHGEVGHGEVGHGEVGHGELGHGELGHGELGHGAVDVPEIREPGHAVAAELPADLAHPGRGDGGSGATGPPDPAATSTAASDPGPATGAEPRAGRLPDGPWPPTDGPTHVREDGSGPDGHRDGGEPDDGHLARLLGRTAARGPDDPDG